MTAPPTLAEIVDKVVTPAALKLAGLPNTPEGIAELDRIVAAAIKADQEGAGNI